MYRASVKYAYSLQILQNQLQSDKKSCFMLGLNIRTYAAGTAEIFVKIRY